MTSGVVMIEVRCKKCGAVIQFSAGSPMPIVEHMAACTTVAQQVTLGLRCGLANIMTLFGPANEADAPTWEQLYWGECRTLLLSAPPDADDKAAQGSPVAAAIERPRHRARARGAGK